MEINVSNSNDKSDMKDLTNTDKDLDEITEFIESRPLAIERWLQERASTPMVERIKQLTIRSSENVTHRNSMTSEMFQQWLSTSACKVNCIKLRQSHMIIL